MAGTRMLRGVPGQALLLGAALAAAAPLVAAAQDVAPPPATTAAVPTEAGFASALKVYPSYQEAVDAHPDQLVVIRPDFWGIYAYALTKSHAGALKMAYDKAQRDGASTLLVINDTTNYFPASAPPRGFFMGGDYYNECVVALDFVPATPDHLLAELRAHIFDSLTYSNLTMMEHTRALLARASQPPYATLAPAIEEFVRDRRAETLPGSVVEAMVLAVASHPAPGLDDSLLRWARYHRHPTIRLTAMRALIKNGHRDQVDALMSSETNPSVKQAISRDLL